MSRAAKVARAPPREWPVIRMEASLWTFNRSLSGLITYDETEAYAVKKPEWTSVLGIS